MGMVGYHGYGEIFIYNICSLLCIYQSIMGRLDIFLYPFFGHSGHSNPIFFALAARLVTETSAAKPGDNAANLKFALIAGYRE